MPNNRTVAIIGGGMAGLAAAKRLCDQGVTIHIFEANSKVGGCCSTTRIGGYTFNDGAMHLAMPGMLDHLFATLQLDRNHLLPLRSTSKVQSATLPDGTIVDIDIESGISVFSPHNATAYDHIQFELNDFVSKWESTLRFFTDDIMAHPLSLPYLLFKGWRHLAKFRGTAADQLNNSFSDESVRAALGGALLYAGAPADKQPAAALVGLVSMLREGFYLPEGGMGRIPSVINDAVSAKGGQIHLNSTVKRILVKNGRVCALEVEGEGVVEADAVISTVSAMHTYRTLLSESDVPSRILRKARNAPLSHRGFVLQLGLANHIDDCSYINCIIPKLANQSQIFQASRGSMQWATYMVPTLTLPEMAPKNCSIVEMLPSIGQNMMPSEWTEEHKTDIAAQSIELLRRTHNVDIAVSRILSPKEFQNDSHLFAGALYGLAPTETPAALFSHSTPIRGLYQAGQTTWPGFGVSGAGLSGVFAAETMMRKEGF
jgi:phytoene desaturase